MISAMRSLRPSKIAFSSAVHRSTVSAMSPVRGYISLVSIGIGSLRLKSMFIVGSSHAGAGPVEFCFQMVSPPCRALTAAV